MKLIHLEVSWPLSLLRAVSEKELVFKSSKSVPHDGFLGLCGAGGGVVAIFMDPQRMLRYLKMW